MSVIKITNFMFRYRVNALTIRVRSRSATVGNVSYIDYRFYDRLGNTSWSRFFCSGEELFAIPDVPLITGRDKNFNAFISRVIHKDYHQLGPYPYAIRIRKNFMIRVSSDIYAGNMILYNRDYCKSFFLMSTNKQAETVKCLLKVV